MSLSYFASCKGQSVLFIPGPGLKNKLIQRHLAQALLHIFLRELVVNLQQGGQS